MAECPLHPLEATQGARTSLLLEAKRRGRSLGVQGAKWTHGGAAEKEAMAKPKERERTKAKGLKAEEGKNWWADQKDKPDGKEGKPGGKESKEPAK
jgi:hypothetical protein